MTCTLSLFEKTENPRLYINGTTRSRIYLVFSDGKIRTGSASIKEYYSLPTRCRTGGIVQRVNKDRKVLDEIYDALEIDPDGDQQAQWDRLVEMAMNRTRFDY